MSNEDFRIKAEEYKRQMLELYGGKPKESISEPQEHEDKAKEEPKEEETLSGEPSAEEIDERFPKPELPDYITQNNTESIENKENEDAYGFLKINVKTGSGGLPLGNNPVLVTRGENGSEELVYMLMTDSSGETGTLSLPTVKSSGGTEPDDYSGAALYNVFVETDGYFSEESRGISVFEGITTVQTFFMTPRPFDYNSGESIVYDNTEPQM